MTILQKPKEKRKRKKRGKNIQDQSDTSVHLSIQGNSRCMSLSLAKPRIHQAQIWSFACRAMTQQMTRGRRSVFWNFSSGNSFGLNQVHHSLLRSIHRHGVGAFFFFFFPSFLARGTLVPRSMHPLLVKFQTLRCAVAFGPSPLGTVSQSILHLLPQRLKSIHHTRKHLSGFHVVHKLHSACNLNPTGFGKGKDEEMFY